MRYREILEASSDKELILPTIEVGDEVKVGKFKNRKAIVKGFTTDDHNQPVLKTTKGDQKLFKPRISKLEEGRDVNRGKYTSVRAKEIGDCAIIAISNITGKSWDEVWEVAMPYFTRYGLDSGAEARVLRHFGYQEDAYFKMPWTGPSKPPEFKPPSMNVRQAETWLKENDPSVTLHCTIYVDGMPHAIAYVGGQFHNVLDAYKAKIRMCYKCTKIG